jgi:LysM repeat protein
MPIAQGTYFIYTVRPNDTPYSIALRLGSNVNEIEQLNALFPPFTDPGLIFPGQLLIVPYLHNPASQAFYFVNPGDALYLIANRFSTNINRLLSLNSQITNPNIIFVNQLIRVPVKIYIVTAGDSFANIARTFGVSISDIIQANQGRPGFSPDLLYPGYGIIIPERE